MTEIRSNQQLENDLSLMDIKIGLLVRNRITLQVLNACLKSGTITHGFPFLDILGYLKNSHKNPKFGKVRQVPIL